MLMCGFSAQDAIPLSKVCSELAFRGFRLRAHCGGFVCARWEIVTAACLIVVAQATIFGLAVSNNYLNMQKRHPTVRGVFFLQCKIVTLFMVCEKM